MKSVLVIDVPEDFDYRRCSMGGDGNIYYEREGEQRTSIIGNIKNLRPLPKKQEIDGTIFKNNHIFKAGFNACLEEITGETE